MPTASSCLLGNHDQGALFDPEGFNAGAERAIFWTREAAGKRQGPRRREKRWEFLGELPRRHREQNGYLFVHGSARNPLNEYVFPEDIYNQRKMERIFALVERYCFQGHTHVPGIFTESLQFPQPGGNGLHATNSDGRQGADQRRLGRPAARRRPAGLLRHAGRRHDQVPPRRVRLREDSAEDLRHPGPGKLPRRPPRDGR